ncbi:Aste57867_15975 [Aphanomyces stellatus]|uniref:Aste57867_15975 protein n=1 Tax=Aphanomyces stellatus TaxID=120398 RepID=A0A485L5E3_9STRA|nr:hypothetical protein As57867_015919 [Aphanomyces stellatus]VFT92760.1 Aste57867_15975 [Aphanomyces stellatus]
MKERCCCGGGKFGATEEKRAKTKQRRPKMQTDQQEDAVGISHSNDAALACQYIVGIFNHTLLVELGCEANRGCQIHRENDERRQAAGQRGRESREATGANDEDVAGDIWGKHEFRVAGSHLHYLYLGRAEENDRSEQEQGSTDPHGASDAVEKQKVAAEDAKVCGHDDDSTSNQAKAHGHVHEHQVDHLGVSGRGCCS